jgi:diaminohydroxyphosphoribosylaminopyrimidine deaminase/5-amino-6-(5-phosphoribosylamino)uracil reductase
LRIVLDSRLRLPLGSQLVHSANAYPILLFTVSDSKNLELAKAGVETLRVEADGEGHPDIEAVLKALAGRGITRLLVEGGPKIHRAFLARGVVDVIYRYRAPHSLGSGLPSALNSLFTPSGTPGPHITFAAGVQVGPDLLESFEIKV